MFVPLLQAYNYDLDQTLTLHPYVLVDYLEQVWSRRSLQRPALYPGARRLSRFEGQWDGQVNHPYQWNHFMYAFLIESTGLYEIFMKIIDEALHGENLGVLSPEGQAWVRNSEELFLKPPPFGAIYSVQSSLRPDIRATRRNAYYRMFGMALPNDGDVEYKRPVASNLEFVSVFEEFLREVWIAIVNANNTSGPDPTDEAAIADRARHLREMLTARRQNGMLSSEEFFAVATMSWFHITLAANSAIVRDLQAHDRSDERRLQRLGMKVGMAPHRNAYSYFRLAQQAGWLLNDIESQFVERNAQALYSSAGIRNPVLSVIDHWSCIFGRNLKAGRVTPYPNIADLPPPSVPEEARVFRVVG
jgi:hypothetical protein